MKVKKQVFENITMENKLKLMKVIMTFQGMK